MAVATDAVTAVRPAVRQPPDVVVILSDLPAATG